MVIVKFIPGSFVHKTETEREIREIFICFYSHALKLESVFH